MPGTFRFIADENFNELIVVGLLRRLPALDIITAREAGLRGVDDPAFLDWAAEHGRILLTHDVQTMAGHAYARLERRLPMSGVLEVPQGTPLGLAIEQIELIIAVCETDEFVGRVRFLPLA